MTVRRLLLMVGAVILLAGVVGLLVPVSVSAPNHGSVGCGNALAPDISQAQDLDNQLANKVAEAAQGIPIVNQLSPQPTHFVAACHQALHTRQWWTIPLTVIGAIAVAAAFVVRGGRAGSG